VTVTRQQHWIIFLLEQVLLFKQGANEMGISRTLIAVAAIVIIVVAVFAIYAGVTYPRTSVSIPISFTVGADSATEGFNQPVLNDKVQVQVSIQNGVALWRAQIMNGDQVIWEHAKGQGEQTNYDSGWIALPSGSYTFTFKALGAGSLEAVVTVTSKGGFW
jgi:hypothetical protein